MSKTISGVIAGDTPPNGLEALIKESDSKTAAKTRKQYVTGSLIDDTGEIRFTVWDEGHTMEAMNKTGSAVIISDAVLSDYKGSPQLTVKRATEIPPERAAASGIIPSSPVSLEDLKSDFEKIVNLIVKLGSGTGFDKITDIIKENEGGFMDLFLKIPGAKAMHHSYLHGLFEHSTQVARLAYNSATVFSKHPSYSKIDLALLLTGALWHDIGKLDEYDLGALGLVERYSLSGGLCTHMVTGVERINSMYRKYLPEHKLAQLQHIILSHHGHLDWGAVMEPATFEAVLIHHADMIDSSRPAFLESKLPSDQLWDKPYGRGRILNPNTVFDDKTSIDF